MGKKKNGQIVPYDLVSPGWEAEYTGESDLSKVEPSPLYKFSADGEGNVMASYSMWGFTNLHEEKWSSEIKHINSMQLKLGTLDENTRGIRQAIGGLICCDSGVPVTIDEILNIIGTGHLPEHSFHRGCWGSSGTRSTQPEHIESMIVIEDILKGLLEGKSEEEFINKYPYVKGFIQRSYTWLKSGGEFSELQRLMLKRMLLPFEYFTKHNPDMYAVGNTCFSEDGEGFKLDAQISELVGLPKIFPIHEQEYNDLLNTISDPAKKDIYKICGHLADCVAGMSDCHHNTYRIIENWIYGIGTLKWGIPTRMKSTEEKRLGQLLFGYSLGLSKWLQGVPHQFLLLDLGHIDLGFDPKNEILRVYAYLGDKRTPLNKWLAACLWYPLTLEANSSLYNMGGSHKEIIERVEAEGINLREWMILPAEGS